MKKLLFLFVAVLLFACSDYDEIEENEANVEHLSLQLSKVEKPDDIYSLFSSSYYGTRAANSLSNEYDFSKICLANIEGRNFNIYIVPTKNTVNDSYLVGVGNQNFLNLTAFVQKDELGNYVLYNDEMEPVMSADVNENIFNINKVFGNDLPLNIQTRVRGGNFSAMCDAAFTGGAVAIECLGLVPGGFLGALGMAACCYVIEKAVC